MMLPHLENKSILAAVYLYQAILWVLQLKTVDLPVTERKTRVVEYLSAAWQQLLIVLWILITPS